jgi:hypothetical protein
MTNSINLLVQKAEQIKAKQELLLHDYTPNDMVLITGNNNLKYSTFADTICTKLYDLKHIKSVLSI